MRRNVTLPRGGWGRMVVQVSALCWLAGWLSGVEAQEPDSYPAPPIPGLVYSNVNNADVHCGPQQPVRFTVSQPVLITSLQTLHRPIAELSVDGSLSLQNAAGTEIGRWPARSLSLTQDMPAALRSAEPGVQLTPGEYVLLDSSADTWCWNAQSGGGMVQIWGVPWTSEDAGQQPPGEDMQRVVLQGLQLDVQLAWQTVPVSSGPVSQLRIGSAAQPDALLQVVRGDSFQDLLSWLITERQAELTQRSEVTLGGRAATAYQFTVSDQNQQGILYAMSEPLPDGRNAGLYCAARTEIWTNVAALLPPVLDAVRIAPPIAIDQSRDGSRQPVDEADAAPPRTVSGQPAWTPPALSWNEPERWYQQPAGYFRIRLPDGWTVRPEMRNKVADPGFDTIVDPTDAYVLICARSGNSVDSADRVLPRYAAIKLGLEKYRRLQIQQLTMGDAPAVRLSYLTEQTAPRAVSRTAFVDRQRFFVINTVAPVEAGTDRLSPNLQEVLDTLEYLPNPASDTFYGPMGHPLKDLPTLAGLTKDFGITVYDNGAVVHDEMGRVDTAYPLDKPGYAIMSGCEAFMNADPVRRQQLGAALTGELIIADYRLALQLFEGGLLIQDPLQRKILQVTHARRDLNEVAP